MRVEKEGIVVSYYRNENKTSLQYVTTPFCLGPPMLPHHPIYHQYTVKPFGVATPCPNRHPSHRNFHVDSDHMYPPARSIGLKVPTKAGPGKKSKSKLT